MTYVPYQVAPPMAAGDSGQTYACDFSDQIALVDPGGTITAVSTGAVSPTGLVVTQSTVSTDGTKALLRIDATSGVVGTSYDVAVTATYSNGLSGDPRTIRIPVVQSLG